MMIEQKRTQLTITDIIVLACIFFGEAIISSSMAYFSLFQQAAVAPETLGFSTQQIYARVVLELTSVFIAAGYLCWRRFDFAQLNFSLNRYTLPMTLLLIVGAGLVANVYSLIHYWLLPQHYASVAHSLDEMGTVGQLSALWLGFSLVNGFYEELFFMGLAFAVAKRHWLPILLFSLLIRFAFHTYQGLAAAATITTLGITFYVARRHTNQLVPFMLAHAYFDVFGLGLPID